MPKKRIAQEGAQSRADTANPAPLPLLPIKAIYRIGDLAKATNIPWRRLKRMLENVDVKFMRVGRLWLVPLSEIERKAGPLWDKIVLDQRAKRALDGR
jgi:hypothetical protein